jgi:hypothetical protein
MIINGKRERGGKEAAELIKENFLDGMISPPQERTQEGTIKTQTGVHGISAIRSRNPRPLHVL